MADAKAPEMSTCEPLEELEWFCPHCGVLRVRLRCEADTYATNVIDQDGCCAFCGYTCCRMSEARALLSAHGLHICNAADKRVLDACAALKIATDAVGPVSLNGKPQICSSTNDLAAAEHARRNNV